MKFLYQQLTAFAAVIVLMILIVGTSFSQLTNRTMQANNYEQLQGYATSALQTQASMGTTTYQAFEIAEMILQKQDVQFVFIDATGHTQYPNFSEKKLDYSLVEKEWAKLEEGQTVYKTTKTNIYGKNVMSAYVMFPTRTSDNKFGGVLIVTQPAKNLTDSIKPLTANLFKGFMISAIIAVILSYIFATIQVKRINRLRKATKEITSGNFSVTIASDGKDEFDDLAEDFNKMAASLEESRKEIERQEERRKQFMADASHEMRTPLTTINGLLEGFQYKAIPADQQENALKLMQNETSRLIRLVNENLDYEKIRTNQISIVVKKFDATSTVQNILAQLEKKAQAAGDQLELVTTEPISVFADYDRFVQILVNILQNAIQFTQNGHIQVTIEKGYLETIVKIKDNGIGMDEEQVKNIWDRYYKADPSRKNTKYGESGLGLSIVHQLMRLHKGKIEVTSELHQGTEFTLSFPDVEIEEPTEVTE